MSSDKQKPLGHVAIAGSPDTLQELRAAGLRTLYLDAAKPPQGDDAVMDWEKVMQMFLK